MNTNSIHDALRLTVESAFYQNNVVKIESLSTLYQMAYNAKDTIVSELEVYRPTELGLPEGALVLVQNHGSVVGRSAKCRRIIDEDNGTHFVKLVQDVIAKNSQRSLIRVDSRVGLDECFCINASLIVPESAVNLAYNFQLNFDGGYELGHRQRIFIYCDPDYYSEQYPDGLVLFDAQSHVAVILGLKYFGEIKKAALTLCWNIANTRGFTACHGGLKIINGSAIAVFGLSGSGKSTLTLHLHSEEDDVTVLHDDAFVVSDTMNKIVALEPSYFDKTASMTQDSKESKSLLTVQNNAVIEDDDGKRVIVMEDRRNLNGRCIKSHFATPHRVYSVHQPINAILWIMKDPYLPPLVKVNGPILASALGATLTTTRSSAENTTEIGKRVIEPYANPFRIYPLKDDYNKFKCLFESGGTQCYIVNTGYFLQKKITPDISIHLLEGIAKNALTFKPLSRDLSYADVGGYEPPLQDQTYQDGLRNALVQRIEFLKQLPEDDCLPEAAIEAIKSQL